jgi:hypothetical protein
MEIINPSVCVLGAGHLAAAVRVQLRLASAPATSSCEKRAPCPALFLACSDFENASLRLMLARRVSADGASVLFASLCGQRVRVGPLVKTHVKKSPLRSYLTRSWDFGLTDSWLTLVSARDASSPYVDTCVTQVAQIGATLVIGELAKIYVADGGTSQNECVAEIDSPLGESDWGSQGQVFGSRCNQTIVVSGVRWRAVRRWGQVWLPSGPE